MSGFGWQRVMNSCGSVDFLHFLSLGSLWKGNNLLSRSCHILFWLKSDERREKSGCQEQPVSSVCLFLLLWSSASAAPWSTGEAELQLMQAGAAVGLFLCPLLPIVLLPSLIFASCSVLLSPLLNAGSSPRLTLLMMFNSTGRLIVSTLCQITQDVGALCAFLCLGCNTHKWEFLRFKVN